MQRARKFCTLHAAVHRLVILSVFVQQRKNERERLDNVKRHTYSTAHEENESKKSKVGLILRLSEFIN